MDRHLAIFLPSLAGGGAEKVMLSLAERFVAHDVKCDLVIAISEGQLLGQVPDGVRLVELHKRKTIHALVALARYLRSERPGCMLATVFPANICALAAATTAHARIRVVTREASPTDIDVLAKHWWGTLLNQISAKLLYRRSDAIIAISRGVRDSLLKHGFANSSQVRIIPNPAPSPAAGTAPSWMAALRRQEFTVIVACGRLEPQKDYPTLLRAFARVRKQHKAKLVILGEGILHRELAALAKEIGIANDTVFAGFVGDPLAFMHESSIFVHSACYEGFGVVLLEALACGLPIVAADSPGGVREVLSDGKYGTLTPVGDDAAMANAILQILRGDVTFPDPTEHLRQFNIEHIADAYLKVLFPE